MGAFALSFWSFRYATVVVTEAKDRERYQVSELNAQW